MILIRFFICICCLVSSPLFAQEAWSIYLLEEDPALEFSAREIIEALDRHGISGVVQHEVDRFTAPGVVLGVTDSPRWRSLLEGPGPELAALGAEGYVIHTSRPEPPLLLGIGMDRRGAMYAGLEIAEQIALGELPPAIEEVQATPHVSFRGVKTNLPWEPYQRGDSTDVNRDEFRNLETWRNYLEVLARGRINALTLWSLNPFEFMVEVEKYPEASRYSAEEMGEWVDFWKRLFKMADAYCIDTYVINWNINIPSGLSSQHGIPRQNQDSPLVRDYLREATRTLIDTYDDLTGFGITTGEEMEGFTPEASAQFVKEVYFAGLKAAKRQVPFIHRSWATTTPESIRTLLAEVNYPAPVYVDLKFNVSHGLSSPRVHFTNFRGHEWADLWDPPPTDYEMVWHIRNEEVYLLHWADPDFVREHVRTNAQPYAVGFFFGPERHLPFLEPWHRLDFEHGRTRWEFRRRWYLPTLWGRLGYSPDLPNSRFERLFDLHYGEAVGSELLRGLTHGSRAILNLLRLHPGGNDVSVYAEGVVGNGTFGGYRSGRGPRFISVLDLIFYVSMEDHVIDIPTFVNQELEGSAPALESLTPLELAVEFERDGRLSGEAVERLEGRTLSPLATCIARDLAAYEHLNQYLAAKVRGAVLLYRFLRTGDAEDRQGAIRHLEESVTSWEKLSEITSSHYAPLISDVIGLYHWSRYIPFVRQDVEIARKIASLGDLGDLMRWQVSEPIASDQQASLFDEGFDQTDQVEWRNLPQLSLAPAVFERSDPVSMAAELEKLDEVEVDLGEILPEGTSAAFVKLVYRSDRVQALTAHLTAQDYMRVRVNGEEVFRSDTVTRSLARPGYDLEEEVYSRMLGRMVPVSIPASANHFGGSFLLPLRKGENEIVFLLDPSGIGRRNFTLRLPTPFE